MTALSPVLSPVHNLPVLRTKGREYPSISYSEISSFGRCRMQHHFTYDLQIERQQFDPKPVFGSMGHAALEAFYAGVDWTKHLDAWVQNEIDRTEMFAETAEMYVWMAEQVKTIVKRYVRHYEGGEDAYQTVKTVEQKFSVRLPGTGRELAGFWDALVEDANGNLWIRDYKFVGGKIATTEDGGYKLSSHGQFRNEWELDMDLQIGLYLWAADRLALPVKGVIYDQIKASLPKVPEALKSGKGMSRARISTDWPTYEAAVVANGFDPDDYDDVFGWASQNEFFRRTKITRGPEELEGFAAEVVRKVKEIKRKPVAVRNVNRMNCSGCPFREPCAESLRGRDVEAILGESYQPRTRRSEQLQLEDDAEEDEPVF